MGPCPQALGSRKRRGLPSLQRAGKEWMRAGAGASWSAWAVVHARGGGLIAQMPACSLTLASALCVCVWAGGGCAGRGRLTARIWLSGAPAGCPSSPAPQGPPWPPSPGSKDALRPGEGASLGPCKGPPPAPSPSPGPGVALIELNCGPHQPPPLFPALAPDRAPAPIFPTPSSPTCLRACLGSAHLH